MKTIAIKIPICKCGCEGDVQVQIIDGIINSIICINCYEELIKERLTQTPIKKPEPPKSRMGRY